MNGAAVLHGVFVSNGSGLPPVLVMQRASDGVVRVSVDNESDRQLDADIFMIRSGPIERRTDLVTIDNVLHFAIAHRALYSWSIVFHGGDLPRPALVVGTIVLHPPWPELAEQEKAARRVLH